MAHDDEHPSHPGPRRDAPEGLSATALAINIALAELQAEWAPAAAPSHPDVIAPPLHPAPPPTPPAWPEVPPPPPVAEVPTGPAPAVPEPPPAPAPAPPVAAEPPRAAAEAPPAGEPDHAGGQDRLTLPRDRIYSMSVPGRSQATRPRPSPKVGKLAASIVVPLIFGMVGAWAYEHLFGAQPAPDAQADSGQSAQPPAQPPDSPPAPDKIAPLKARIDRVADRVDVLTKGLDAVSRKPEPTADLSAIRRRLDALDEAVAEIKTLEVRINRIDERLAAAEKSPKGERPGPTDAQSKAEKPDRPATPVTPVSTTLPEPGSRDVAGPVLLDVFGEEEMLEKGTDSFKKGNYKDAAEVFRVMEHADPDDARVWYFAALTRGLVTGQWDGETTRLAEKGVERERSGTPGTALIDAAFRDLTQVTGKEWLAYYRTRASAGK